MNAINGVVPLGERQRLSLASPPVVYLIAAMLSGGLVAVTVSVVSRATDIPSPARTAIAIAGLVALASRELGWARFAIPDLGLIVPRRLVIRAPAEAAGIWGAVLGAGFLTLVKFGVFWGFQLTLFALAEPEIAVWLGTLYGISRAAPALVVWRIGSARAWWQCGSPRVYSLGYAAARLGGIAMALSAAILSASSVFRLL